MFVAPESMKATSAHVEPFCKWLGTVMDEALEDTDL